MGKEGQKGLDPLVNKVRVFRVFFRVDAQVLDSGVVLANQTQKGRFASQFAKTGYFSEFGAFALDKQCEFTKSRSLEPAQRQQTFSTIKFEAAPRPSLFRGVHQFVWNHLKSVSCHSAEQLQPLSTKHSRVVTRQFSKKTPQLADPRNGAVLEPTKNLHFQ